MKPFSSFDTAHRGYAFGVPTFYNNFHLGVDYLIEPGTPLFAVTDGRVEVYPNTAEGGNMVYLYAKNYIFRYLHLKDMAVGASYVKEGQVIGHSGGEPGLPSSGNSTGAHLHFDIQRGTTSDLYNHAAFFDPDTFNYQSVSTQPMGAHQLYTFKFPGSPDVFSLGKFDSIDELNQSGSSESQILKFGVPTLVRNDGDQEVFLRFSIPTFDAVTPFGLKPGDQAQGGSVLVLTTGDIVALENQIKALQAKVTAAKAALS